VTSVRRRSRTAKAWRGYYIRLGDKGYEFVQDIGDEFFFTPTHAALVAERCELRRGRVRL
jgi:hypothetical protein